MARPNQPTISAALKIIATGIALPPDQITSQQLDVQLNKPVGYVERRSGICWRYFARNDASQAELAAEALHNALVAAALNPTDIDLLICASAIAVQALPCSAIHILKAAAMPAGVAGFDINSSCVSFISALEVAAGLLNCGAYRRIAIVSADIASRGIDWDHEESSLIFGDGAACAIVERGDGRSGIIASLIEMYPEGSELCEIRAGGTRRNPRSGVSDSDFLFHMQGNRCFVLLLRLLKIIFLGCCKKAACNWMISARSFHIRPVIFPLNICVNGCECRNLRSSMCIVFTAIRSRPLSPRRCMKQ